MKQPIRYAVLALIGVIVIAAGASVSQLLFELRSTRELTAPIAAIIVPFITGAFTLTGVWLANKLKSDFDKEVVCYGQEVVLKAFGGEYVVLEGDQQILRALSESIQKAQRFVIAPFKNPHGRPKNRPVKYGDEVVLRAVPIKEKRFVAAHEKMKNIPLVVLLLRDTLPDTWEQLTLVRPEGIDAEHNLVRFGWAFNLRRHNGQWAWCNYLDAADRGRVYGNLNTSPRTMENFHFENPEATFIGQIDSRSIYSFIAGVLLGVAISFLVKYF
jgi:hypothetical protein